MDRSIAETMVEVDRFHAWLLRLDAAGVPIRFTHTWRSLADELATARQCVSRLDELGDPSWHKLASANLSPRYTACLLAWLSDPRPEQLEGLIRAESARFEHRRHAWVAWAGAGVLALVGLFALWIVIVAHVPQYQMIAASQDMGDTFFLSRMLQASPSFLHVLLVVIAAGLIATSVFTVRRSMRAPALQNNIDNALLARAAAVTAKLDLDDSQVRESVAYTPLQQWASLSEQPSKMAEVPGEEQSSATSSLDGPVAGLADRRSFSSQGHQWMLEAVTARSFRRGPMLVSVVVGGLFALAVGGLVFGAMAELIVVISGQ